MSRAVVATIFICTMLAGCLPLQQDAVLEQARIENARVEQMLEQASARPSPQSDNDDACPPLPTLHENPTRFEGRLFTLTVIALYEQCAKSKK